jgi:hypothetical protein
MSTHIYVLSSDSESSVISKLESVFKVPSRKLNSSYKSPNKKVFCQLSELEKIFITTYIADNPYFKFNNLKAALKKQSFSADNVILSSYLRSKGCFPGSFRMHNGSLIKLWSKEV